MQWKIKFKILQYIYIYVHEQNNSKQIWVDKKKGWDKRKKNMTWKQENADQLSC